MAGDASALGRAVAGGVGRAVGMTAGESAGEAAALGVASGVSRTVGDGLGVNDGGAAVSTASGVVDCVGATLGGALGMAEGCTVTIGAAVAVGATVATGLGDAGASVGEMDAVAGGGSGVRAGLGVGVGVGTAVGRAVCEGVGVGVCTGVGAAVCTGVGIKVDDGDGVGSGATSGCVEAESGSAALGAGLFDGRRDGVGVTAVTQAVASTLTASSIAPAATDRGPIVMPIEGPSLICCVYFRNQYNTASVPALGQGWVLPALLGCPPTLRVTYGNIQVNQGA